MIGFIGGGNMAEALIKGMVQSGMKDIIVSEPREDRRAYLEKTYGAKTTSDNKEVVRQSAIVILAVKPQNMDDVTSEIAPFITGRETHGFNRRRDHIAVSYFEAQDVEGRPGDAEHSCPGPGRNVCSVDVRMHP